MSNHPTSKAAEFEALVKAAAYRGLSGDTRLFDWCWDNCDLIATALRLHEIASNPSDADLGAIVEVWPAWVDGSWPHVRGAIRNFLAALRERAEQRASEDAK